MAAPTIRLTSGRTPLASRSTATEALNDLQALANPELAAFQQRFFKTGKGEYGEGDVFLGIKVPPVRLLSKKHRAMPLEEALKLLHSPLHEARLLALHILVDQFKRENDSQRKAIYNGYLANRSFINNWDLVDTSARDIVGGYLLERSHKPLFELAKSQAWNDRRIAVIATFHFIAHRRFDTTLALAERLLHDPHDLMHKAIGWMLREVGKRDAKPLHAFLEQHAHRMPRTMLRYAIEKLTKIDRAKYMARRALNETGAARFRQNRAARR